MLDYAAYVTAQRSTRDLARSALPGAPLVPTAAQASRLRRVRRGAALALHRLAGRVGPA
jgi:hypothetical protein